MIRRVTVRNFKHFEEQTFEFADSVVLLLQFGVLVAGKGQKTSESYVKHERRPSEQGR